MITSAKRFRWPLPCPVANGYGGRDAGFIAHECPSGGMHIHGRRHHRGNRRCTRRGSADRRFRRNRSSPIWRPRISLSFAIVPVMSARFRANAAPAGRGLPLLKEIQGRATDFVLAADGTILHGLSLIYILRDISGVRAFKVVQESRLQTRVLLVTEPPFAPL